jgi:chromate reductase, NAD(P)H dehydrogenase (quinone)
VSIGDDALSSVAGHLLLITGSTRAESSNSAVLRTARMCAPEGVTASLFPGLADLPAFNPDVTDAHAGPFVGALRTALAAADGVVFCAPEFAGTLPGSLKNLLDWVVGSGELYGKPVAWINTAVVGRGEGAQASLASVLAYLGAVPVEAACIALPTAGTAEREDGMIKDPEIRSRLTTALGALIAAAATTEPRPSP